MSSDMRRPSVGIRRPSVSLRTVDERRRSTGLRGMVRAAEMTRLHGRNQPVENSKVGRRESYMSVGRGISYGLHASYGVHSLHSASSQPVANTCQLGPQAGEGFEPSRVQRLLQETLTQLLNEQDYQPHRSADLTQTLCDVIRAKVKDLGYKRYKFVCQVSIGQQLLQGVQYCSRAACNTDTDNFATATFSNQTMFAIALVHAMYLD